MQSRYAQEPVDKLAEVQDKLNTEGLSNEDRNRLGLQKKKLNKEVKEKKKARVYAEELEKVYNTQWPSNSVFIYFNLTSITLAMN